MLCAPRAAAPASPMPRPAAAAKCWTLWSPWAFLAAAHVRPGAWGRQLRSHAAAPRRAAGAAPLELTQTLRAAPPGLVKALKEVLDLPHEAAPEDVAVALGANPQMTLTLCAVKRASKMAGSKEETLQVVGFPPNAGIQDPEGVRNKLAELFSNYLAEIWEIVQVSSVFKELSVPVSSWRRPWADGLVTARHAQQLWAPHLAASPQDFNQLLSGLGIGVAVLDAAVSPQLAEEAYCELETLANEGKLSEFSQSTCNPGSQHLWLRFAGVNSGPVPPALRRLGEALAGLPGALEAKAKEAQVPCPRLRLVPNLMAATYGHGSHYVPHKDMYSGGSCGFENTRMLTILCYLNPHWQPGDGGELRLFNTSHAPPSSPGPGSAVPRLLGIKADHSESTTSSSHGKAHVDLAPLLGRVVIFRSREAWHGIQPSRTARRWAVTLWVLAEEGPEGVASDEEEDSDQILKNWQIKDIGLQASAKIKSSKTPLLTLMRLSQNFPAQVVGLSKRSVSKSLRRKSDELRQFMRDGAEVFSMNGRLVRPDHSELSLFPLMQTLHPFFVGVERLVRLGISERVACEILKEVKGRLALQSFAATGLSGLKGQGYTEMEQFAEKFVLRIWRLTKRVAGLRLM
eukprot:s532_g2.t2